MKLQRTIIIILFSFFISYYSEGQNVISGIVTITRYDRHGAKIEEPIADVLVSDAFSFAKTDANGRYNLNVNKAARYVSIVSPESPSSANTSQKLKDANEYNFNLIENKSASKSFSFLAARIPEKQFQHQVYNEINKIAIGRNVDFIITLGERLVQNDSLQILNFPTTKIEESPYPERYAFYYEGVLFVVISDDQEASAAVGWLNSLLKEMHVNQPIVIVNNSNNLYFYNNTLTYDNQTVSLTKYNIRTIISGSWDCNFYGYKGKLEGSTVSLASINKGGVDHTPSNVRLFNVASNFNITTDLIPTNVNPQIVIASPIDSASIENNRIRVYVNTFSSSSYTVKVTAGISADSINFKWFDLNQSSQWNWNGFILCDGITPGFYTLRTKATFQSGEVISTDKRIYISNLPLLPFLVRNTNNSPANFNSIRYRFNGKLAHYFTVNAQGKTLFTSPIAADSIAVVVSTNELANDKNTIKAFNIYNGKSIWHFFTKGAIVNNISFCAGNVLATDQLGNIYAIDLRSGMLKWSTSVNINRIPGITTGSISKDSIYYTGIGNSLAAVDAKNGKMIWRSEENFNPDGSSTTLALGNGILLTSSNLRGLAGFNAKNGNALWKHQDERLFIREGSARYNSNLFQLVANSCYYEISPLNGDIIRTVKLPFEINSNGAPLVIGDTLIVGTSSNGLVAFDLQTKNEIWRVTTKKSLINTNPYSDKFECSSETTPLLIGNYIIFGTSDGNLYVVDKRKGSINQKIELGAPIIATPTLYENLLIVIDYSGNLSSFRISE